MNPSQRRSVANTLRMFEESLRNADAWLDGGEVTGILYHQRLDLSADRRQAAQQRIKVALDQIAALVLEIDLEQEQEDMSGLIRADMSLSWANLLDLQSEKLRRFGEVDPKLKVVLDPILLQLAQAALELANVFDGQSAA